MILLDAIYWFNLTQKLVVIGEICILKLIHLVSLLARPLVRLPGARALGSREDRDRPRSQLPLRRRTRELDGRMDNVLLGVVDLLVPLRRDVHRKDFQGEDHQAVHQRHYDRYERDVALVWEIIG